MTWPTHFLQQKKSLPDVDKFCMIGLGPFMKFRSAWCPAFTAISWAITFFICTHVLHLFIDYLSTFIENVHNLVNFPLIET